jgi:chromate transporter
LGNLSLACSGDKLPGVVAFVDGITAAAAGAITGSVIVLAWRSITDVPTILIAVVTAILLWKFKKLQEPVVIAAAAAAGLVIYPLMHS